MVCAPEPAGRSSPKDTSPNMARTHPVSSPCPQADRGVHSGGLRALAPHVGSQLAWDMTAGLTGWPLDIHLLTQQHLKAAADEGGLARGN